MPDSWRRRADDALVTLARDRWTILTGYAFLLTGDRQEAEDLVQEALVRTFARSRSINPAAMEGYVRRAILTVYIDGHRRRRRWRDRMHLLVPPQAHDGPDAAVGQGIEVRDALAALPRQQRACVVLRFYDELSIQEVAAAPERAVTEALAALPILMDDGEVLYLLDAADNTWVRSPWPAPTSENLQVQALSPDGRSIAHTVYDGERPQMQITELATGAVTEIAPLLVDGAECWATLADFVPDGESLAVLSVCEPEAGPVAVFDVDVASGDVR